VQLESSHGTHSTRSEVLEVDQSKLLKQTVLVPAGDSLSVLLIFGRGILRSSRTDVTVFAVADEPGGGTSFDLR
jgi:hypothetical protein